MKLTDAKRSATNTVLLFGPPKSGKTELASKLSSEFNLLWFDLENGWATLTKLPAEQQERIELVQLPDTRSYPIAIETMLKVIKGNKVSICNEHGKVDCAVCKKLGPTAFATICLNDLGPDTIFVVDSLTQLTNSAIANITKLQPDDYKLNYDDWGNLGKLMDIFLSHVQQAKYNVVCITHETEVEMEDGKSKLVPTSGTRNFSRNTAKYFGHCVYVEVKNKQHRAASSTTFATNILTGSRTDVVLENGVADLLRIFKPELFANEQQTSGATGSNATGATGTQAATSLTNLQRLKAGLAK